MSTYERVNYVDVEPVSGAMHSLSDSLDSEQVDMEAGDTVWIPPEATRQIRNGETESAFVLVSACFPLSHERVYRRRILAHRQLRRLTEEFKYI